MVVAALAVLLAQGSVCRQACGAEDPILATLSEEVRRTADALVLPDSPRPYFVACSLQHDRYVHAQATLGALVGSYEGQYARLNVTIRVGDYQLDNSNFMPKQMWSGWSRLDVDVPIDGDTGVIRRAIWWSMDQAYKTAVEDLKRKKAVLKNLSAPPVADDFAKAPAVTYDSGTTPPPLPPVRNVEEQVRLLSALMKENRVLRNSAVEAAAAIDERWYVNSEGAKIHVVQETASLSASASAQADDGVMVGDAVEFLARSVDGLPPVEKQKAEIRELGKRVEAMRNAPLEEDFVGPVLFEGKASAELCARLLPAAFSSRREPIAEEKGAGGGSGDAQSLRRKIGRRVMAAGFSVVDDPTQESLAGIPLMGHMPVDYEGVKPEKVQLVENGILKTLLTTRTPDKRLPVSNGHAVSFEWGMFGNMMPKAGITSLFVSYKDGMDDARLYERLLQAIKDQGVEYGLRVRGIPQPDLRLETGASYRRYGADGEGNDMVIQQPLYVCRVYPDGREQLVRVVSFKGIALPAFKDVLAAGKTAFVYNRSSMGDINTLVCPSILFEEGMVMKPEKDISKPPLLPSPAMAGKDTTPSP